MNPKTETAGETPAYLTTITVGELIRFLGKQRVEAGRAGDRDMLKHLVLMADGVEKALKFYNKCALPPCALKLSDCATTLEEARGVIDRQEALIEQLRKDEARLVFVIRTMYPSQFAEIIKWRKLEDSLAAIDAAMEEAK